MKKIFGIICGGVLIFLVLSGLSPDGELVEMIELPDHPFFVASQFHPEFKSKPFAPHPLFAAFIAAAHERVGESD